MYSTQIGSIHLQKQQLVKSIGRPKYVTVLPDSKFEVSHSEFQIYLPKKSLKKIFKKKILVFNAASKPLKFYYIDHYSRSRSDNFRSYCTHFWLEFFDGFYISGILVYHIYNKISILE